MHLTVCCWFLTSSGWGGGKGGESEGEKRGGRVGGGEGVELFGPQMALAYLLDAISQDPKNSTSRVQPPATCPRNVSARIKNITVKSPNFDTNFA